MVAMGIIGTAGRGDDAGHLTADHYNRMVHGAIKLISHLKIDPSELTLVSGGAAWADHLVVTLTLMGVIPPDRLMLFLPAKLVYYGFEGGEGFDQRTADTANYYHKMFKAKTGVDSINELLAVQKQGAVVEEVTGGFFTRNSMVASTCLNGHILAFTFGADASNQVPWTVRSFNNETKAKNAGLKDGGTADTWNKSKCQKHHARIGQTTDDTFYI